MSPLARQDSPNTPTSAEPELDKDQMRAVAQVQRWHDFKAHLGAYPLINAVLIIVWAVTGGGTFWPGISLAAWGRGLSSQHFLNSFSPITTERVRPELRRQRDR
jgi:2TM domain